MSEININKRKVERIGLRLYKLFGYPDDKELGVDLFEDGWPIPSAGEIYNINLLRKHRIKDRNLPGGKSIVLFTRDDIEKLSSIGTLPVELVITNKNKLLVIIHHLYYDPYNPEYRKPD